MSTTTVRLAKDDEQILDRLAAAYGGRSNAIRQALHALSADLDRHAALEDFLAAWEEQAGPIDDEAVDAMAQRLGL